MATIVCGHCGTENSTGLQFCSNCDKYLNWSAEGTDSAAKSAAGPAESTPPPTPPSWRDAETAQQPPVPDAIVEHTAAPQIVTTGGFRPPELSSSARQSPAQRPALVMASPAQPAAPTRPTQPVQPTGEGPSRCDRCGRRNELTRRFCSHCGEWLVTPTQPSGGDPAGLGSVGDRMNLAGRRFRRRWSGDRGPYRGRLQPSVIAFRAAVTVAIIVVVGLTLGLAGLQPLQLVTDEIGHLRGSGRVDRTTLTAGSDPSTEPARSSAGWAIDDVRDRGWETTWIAATPGNSGQSCGTGPAASAAANTLTIRFAQPTDIREIGIEPGLPNPPERTDRWQPRTLELVWDNLYCQRAQLANSPGLQRFGVQSRKVSTLRITVVSGYQPAGGARRDLELGEVTFWHR